MVSDVRQFLALELFDSRVTPPRQLKFQVPVRQELPTTLFDALVQLQLVTTRDDPLFQKKGGVGVFSIPLGPNDPVYEGDRIELYREILIDPKKARRKKANQNKDAELKTKAKIRKDRKDSRVL